MHLGSRIFERISKRPNFKGLLEKVKNETRYFTYKPSDNDAISKLWQGIRLACLLHDIGHFPFSHSMERVVLEYIQTVYDGDFNNNFEEAQKEATNNGKNLKLHEFITLKMLEEGQKEIDDIIKKSSNISSFEMAKDVLSLGNKNLLSMLGVLGNEIDADRMDYVLRDTTMAGATFGSYDVERLIFSLDLHEGSDGFFEILPDMSGISAVESFFLERLKLYKYLNHHHTVVLYDTLLELTFRLLFMKESELNELNNEERKYDRGIDPNWFHYKNFCPDRGPIVDDHLIKCRLHELYIRLLEKIDYERKTNPDAEKTLMTLEFDKAILEAVLFRAKYHLPLWKDNLEYKQVNECIKKKILDHINHNSNNRELAEKLRLYVNEYKDTLLLNKIRKVFLGGIQDLNGFHRFVKKWVFKNGKPYFIGTEAKLFTPLEPEDLFPAIKSKWAKQKILMRGGEQPERLEKASALMEGLIDYAGKEIELFAYLILPDYKKYEEAEKEEKKAFLEQGREDFLNLLVNWIFEEENKIEMLWQQS